MIDEKLIKEKLFCICNDYEAEVDVRDNGEVIEVILDREYRYKSFAEALMSQEDYLLETKNELLSKFDNEEQEILDIIERLKKEALCSKQIIIN